MSGIFIHYDTVQGQIPTRPLNEDYCLCVVQALRILIKYLKTLLTALD